MSDSLWQFRRDVIDVSATLQIIKASGAMFHQEELHRFSGSKTANKWNSTTIQHFVEYFYNFGIKFPPNLSSKPCRTISYIYEISTKLTTLYADAQIQKYKN